LKKVPLDVTAVKSLWTNIDFLSMDYHTCYGIQSSDSEELYWRHKIVERYGVGLSGIVEINELAEAGRHEDVFESICDSWHIHLALSGACRGGQKELVLLVLKKLKSSLDTTDLNRGLAEACRGGHKELALLMIEKGAWNVDWGLLEACRGGNKELALLMIEKGAWNVGWGLREEHENDHEELVLLMIQEMKSSGGAIRLR
jgi:hypothetical protein